MIAARSQNLFASSPPRQIFTVSELTSLVRTSLELQFQDIWLEGEVSNLRAPGSGHLYWTIKDETSQIRAVLFRSNAIRLRFAPQEGMQVVVKGRLTVYEARGEYQIVVEAIEPKGIGALQLAYEQLKTRLAAEGLFDPTRKKPLPSFPSTVGIVTSLTGAAIRDILAVLQRRWPVLHVVIAPVQVQGEGAAAQIADALRMLNQQARVDVIIVGRGGGTLEDLWAFNDEMVVRAIAASHIPVVAAVGHEIDFTLADFAADYRAATPSAAAETVVPVLSDVLKRLRNLTVRAGQAVMRYCLAEHRHLEANVHGLAQIRYRIQRDSQMIDDLTDRLQQATLLRLARGRDHVREEQQELTRLNPILTVQRGLAIVPQFMKRLEQQMRVITVRRRRQVEAAVARLDGLSPLAVLGRGYSILKKLPEGSLVKRVRDVRSGDHLSAQIADGRLECRVRNVVPDPSV
jgi:exodeoxyribonuclease VII large subunit